MNDFRDALEQLARDAEVYGDLDAAIEQEAADGRRRRATTALVAVAASVVLAVGVVATIRPDDRDAPVGPTDQPSSVAPSPPLEEGAVTPGRHVGDFGDFDAEVTVPDGWWWSGEYLVRASLAGTRAPDGASLVMLRTGTRLGLYTDPCQPSRAENPDVEVGPGVDDFVDAVVAEGVLDVSTPTDVSVDGHRGRFFELRAPSRLGDCVWRPWSPGLFAQGPANAWDVWVLDVDGRRVLVVASRFPGTPAGIRGELRRMVESVHFLP